jgi:hypothetical protein
MFMLIFFRGKYGPPVLLVAGLVSLAIGVTIGHVVPDVVGAGLIVRGFILWILGKRRTQQTSESHLTLR